MSFTHANALDAFGVTPLIVATSAANGSHTTLAGALAAAVSGQTVFLRDSVTENVTLPAGVNIASWSGSSANTSSVTGKITMTGAGTSTISGIQLITNSDYCVEITGSAASILNIDDCYINATASNNAIHYTTSSGSSIIFMNRCKYNLTSNTLLISTSAGQLFATYCYYDGSPTTVASTLSAGFFNARFCEFPFPITTTSTAGLALKHCTQTQNNNTCITHGGTGAGSVLQHCNVNAGNASVISIGTGATLAITATELATSNTNVVTGAGTAVIDGIFFSGTGNTMNVTTVTNSTVYPGAIIMPVAGGSGTPTSNTMTTYEEGTWVPTITGSGTAGSPTYTDQHGYYIKTGSLVTVWFNVAYSAISGSPTGDVTLGALPFTSSSSTSYFASGCGVTTGGATWPASHTMFVWQIGGGATTAVAASLQSGGSQSNIAIASGNFVWRGTITYRT